MKTQEIKKLLKEQRMYPKKGLGQHFLVHEGMLELISKAASLKKGDVVFEVGPGLGVLTRTLAERVKRVVAVEKDGALVRLLECETVGMKNIEVIHADILKLDLSNIPTFQHSYKVVANLPYYITSPVIRKFLEAKVQPKVMVLMVQKEVAQRICAKPPHMSILAVSVQAYAEPEIVSIVPKNAFWPQPKVDSAIIKITPTALKPPTEFFAVVKAGFKQPRKQLGGNLGNKEILQQLGISPKARAETLSIQDWLKLAKSFSKK